MAFPPPTLPTTRSNTTVMTTTHPADHNAANLAINDLTAEAVKQTRSGFTANWSGTASNNAQIPWAATANVGGWTVATSCVVPAGVTGLFAVTVRISYGAVPAASAAIALVISGITAFYVSHPSQQGGGVISAVVPLSAGQTMSVTVAPGVGTIAGTVADLWCWRVGPSS